MKKIKIRIKMAWKAFFLIPFEVDLTNYYISENPYRGKSICDNHLVNGNPCKEIATTALYKDIYSFSQDGQGTQYLCCTKCALEAVGSIYKKY